MTEPCNRLLKARAMAGYRSGRAAAAAIGVRPATYAAHENGSRNFGVPDARKYAEQFNVSPGWLLTGEALDQGDYHDARFQSQPNPLPRQQAKSDDTAIDVYTFGRKILDLVSELAPHTEFSPKSDARTLAEVIIERMLDQNYDPEAEQWRIISQWDFPTSFIENDLGIPPSDDPALIAVVDDNMSPTYNVGDRLIMNFSTKEFHQDGVYIFMDSKSGLHLQRLSAEDESNIRISNDNPGRSKKHPAHVVALDTIEIVGQVRGSVLVG